MEKWDKSNFISSTSFWASEGRREVAVREEYLGHPSFSSHIAQQLSMRQNSTHTVWQQYWMLPLAILHILVLLHAFMLNRFDGCYINVSNVSNTLFSCCFFNSIWNLWKTVIFAILIVQSIWLYLQLWMRNNAVWLRSTRLYFKYWTCRSEKTFKSLIMKYDYILIDCKAVEILLYLCVCWPVFFCGSSLRSDLWAKHPVYLQGLDRDRQRQIELSSSPNQTIFGGPCDYCGNCKCNNHKHSFWPF